MVYNGDHQTILSAKYYATFRTLLDMVLSLNLCTTRVTYLKQVLVYTGESHQEYGEVYAVMMSKARGNVAVCCYPAPTCAKGLSIGFVRLSVCLSSCLLVFQSGEKLF